jgi:hypothetical protein
VWFEGLREIVAQLLLSGLGECIVLLGFTGEPFPLVCSSEC